MGINFLNITNGVNLIEIPAKQYKTNLISLYIKRPLDENEVTKNALLPYVLRAGSKNYDTQLKIAQKLQLLYGSSLSVNVTKAGEKQIMTFKMAFTNDRYLEENIQEDVLDMLFDIVFNPNIVNESFDEKKMEIEKISLKEALLARINNKSVYAMDKMVSIMFEGEPFRMIEDGFVEDLENINGKNLYEHYKNIIRESEIDIAITGNIDKNLVERKIKSVFNSERQVLEVKNSSVKKQIGNIKEVQEHMDVNQGKLILGYRTNIELEDTLNVPLSVYSTILGGSVSSKLFRNVREKHSLAYSIGSSLDRVKGALFIHAGIEITDFEKAKELIFEQLDAIESGDVSEDELDKAKKTLINSIKSVKDSVESVADYIYALGLQGNIFTPETMIERIESVRIDEIIDVAKQLKLDTIYFLTNKEGKDE